MKITRKKVVVAAIVVVAAVVLLPLLYVFIQAMRLRAVLQDKTVPVVATIVPEGAPAKALFVFPHPDDEIMCAGTIRMLHEQEAETTLLCLTRGDKGNSDIPTGGRPLAEIRMEELKASAEVLGIDNLEVREFPDGGLSGVGREAVKREVLAAIEKHRPSVVVTYDAVFGFYGHPDHVFAAACTIEAVREGARTEGFPVRRLLSVTLCRGMIRLALKYSPGFRKIYPTDPAKGVPPPDLAVIITPYGAAKQKAIMAHRSQKKVFDSFLPYHEKIPPGIFFRLLDREYFAEVPISAP